MRLFGIFVYRSLGCSGVLTYSHVTAASLPGIFTYGNVPLASQVCLFVFIIYSWDTPVYFLAELFSIFS